jgi:hypothetical protein
LPWIINDDDAAAAVLDHLTHLNLEVEVEVGDLAALPRGFSMWQPRTFVTGVRSQNSISRSPYNGDQQRRAVAGDWRISSPVAERLTGHF